MAFMAYHMHRKAWAWVNTRMNALSDSTGDIHENPDKNLDAQAGNGCVRTCAAPESSPVMVSSGAVPMESYGLVWAENLADGEI